jgi:hypothetical protein
MKLFSRKSEAPAAPKPTRKGVTGAELNVAISAVRDVMGDCTARQTLERLWNDIGADDSVMKLDVSVSLAELDKALVEVDKYDELTAATLGPLKRFRALLAKAEEKVAQVDGVPVTRAEFDALVEAVAIVVLNIDAAQDRRGYPDGRVSARLGSIIAASGELNVSSAVASMLQKITGQISIASENAGARDRKRAGSRLNIVPGGGGRPNY